MINFFDLQQQIEMHAMKKKQRLAEVVPYLPQHVYEGILSRLPVKTLITLKSVCRSWNNLISQSPFSKLHLKQYNRINLIYLHDSHSTLVLPDTDDDDDNFLASCNGLLCISLAGGDVFLCNPSTHQTRKIPNSNIDFFPTPMRASVFFGLGYHSPSDDYRLVRISMFEGVDFRTEVKMYSRNTDTWRRLDDFPYDFPLARPGVFADGCLHWIVSMWDDDDDGDNYVRCRRRDSVALLDLADESYGLIQLPAEVGSRVLYLDIGSLEEKLAAFYSCDDGTCDIWVRKEHRRAESWTRMKMATDCDVSCRLEAYFYKFHPLCFLKPLAAGQILLRLGTKKIVSFDDVEAEKHLLDCRMLSFVESLVSPFAP